MKAYTSRERFDERRRFTGVFHQMGRPHLDSDHNEGVRLEAQDRIRRSGDLCEGSPDDGFLISPLHLVEPIRSSRDFVLVGADEGDTRVVPLESGLTRREPESLPHVFRARGIRALTRTLDAPLDLDRLPIPTDPAGATFAAQALVLRLRVVREITDDDTVDPHLVLLDRDGAEHRVPVQIADRPAAPSLLDLGDDWQLVRIPRASWSTLPAEADGSVRIRGWGLRLLSLRSEVLVGELLADPALPETDFVIRGGDGPLQRAGRIYVRGLRSFLETDWRYSLQPDLPLPPALVVPTGAPGEPPHRYLAALDLWEREVTALEDDFLLETALDGEDTTWRRRLVSQVRLLRFEADEVEQLPPETSGARLTTNVPDGAFPDRYPPEEADPCRDACLFTENASTGLGYRGTDNLHVRIEVLRVAGREVVLWSRHNAAAVAPLAFDAPADASSVVVDPTDALQFRAGDLVVIEDRHSRLDPSGARPPRLRQLRSVNAATGQLEFHGAAHTLTTDPVPLPGGGALGRAFATADKAAVRRWDGADWRLDAVRYNLQDGLTFRFSGEAARDGEYWTFTARVEDPDGGSAGVVETLTEALPAGPRHAWAALARLSWPEGTRVIDDLRDRFLPLKEVRDRLIELGRRKLSPGAFTVVVGDGVRTFGDIDQELAEGVTGDEAIQHAVDKVRLEGGGTVYVRAGTYLLEHAVLLEGVSRVHILGDGDASLLRVTGAGGAFYLDDCGAQGQVEIELLRIEEDPDEDLVFGEGGSAGGRTGVIPVPADAGPRRFLVPSDLIEAQPSLTELATQLGASLKQPLDPLRRVARSVVGTLERLRALQRQNPGRPLEDVAPEELEVLRGLPHGVVTVSDSTDVRLRRLSLTTEEAPAGGGLVAGGVLVTGTCSDVVIEDNRVAAPYGVVAAAYASYLGPAVLALRPIASLRLQGVRVRSNRLTARGQAEIGVRLADGLLEGVEVTGNRIEGFPTGVSVEDRAEVRPSAPVDRTRIADNQVLGSTRAAIQLRGDGVEVVGNELRPSASTEAVQVGVLVVGVAIAVRGCWIELPGGAAPDLALAAGIVVGDGVDAELARPVGDVEIADNRIEAGAGSSATGILLGGSQPIFDVRIRGNVLRALGDAGIRAWGHGGPIGSLRIEDNRIEDVARQVLGWRTATRDALAALAPNVAGLASATSARAALQALLAHPNDAALPGIDALLRWLERSTLRGGIVLSQVEQAVVRGNQVSRVGSATLPAGWQTPGAEVRTAGIAAVGGLAVTVTDNRVDQVQGAVQVVTPPQVAAPPVLTLPILDRLRAMGLAAPTLADPGQDLYGSLVSLRAQLTTFTGGNATQRSALTARLFAPLAAAAGALEALGGGGATLARELTTATEELSRTSGEAQTAAAHRVRTALSDALGAAAADSLSIQTWQAAARLDRAMLREPTELAAEAGEARKLVPTLTRGMEALNLGLDAALAKLQKSPENAAQRVVVSGLMDRVGAARSELADYERGLVGTDLGASTRALLGSLTDTLVGGVGKLASGGQVDPAAYAELGALNQSLVGAVNELNTKLALDLSVDFGQLVDAHGKLDEDALTRLKATLERIRGLSKTGDTTAKVSGPELDRLLAIYGESLVRLTAAALEGAVRDATVGGTSSGIKRLIGDAGQLQALVAKDAELEPYAAAVTSALEKATSSRTPQVELGQARDQLASLQQALTPPIRVAVQGEAAPPDESLRLAVLGQTLLDLRSRGDAEQNRTGLALFAETTSRLLDRGTSGSFARRASLARIESAIEVLSRSARGEAADAAWFALADELDRVTLDLSVGAKPGTPQAAVVALVGSMRRALDPAIVPTSRPATVAAFLATRRQALSSSLLDRMLGATEAERLLEEIRRGLAGITGVAGTGSVVGPVGSQDTRMPADGVFTSGVQQQLDLVGNELVRAKAGVTVRDPRGHVLADPDVQPGAVIRVAQNRVLGCVSAGLDIRPGTGNRLDASGNLLSGCLGLADDGQTSYGPAVVALIGEGELSASGNQVHENLDPKRNERQHGILVDWRGDVALAHNRVRDVRGVGLLVLAEPVPAELVRGLATTAALELEPAPSVPPPSIKAESGGLFKYTDSLFELGAFKAVARTVPTYRVLTEGARTLSTSTLAADYASQWMAPVDTLVIEPLLEFTLRIPLLPFFPILPRPRRAVSAQGNDVVAHGPALQVLANGGALVSATVVGNDLESTGATGAVYLRRVDTTIFAGNRCESPEEVNVVVIRAGAALVSVTGNTLAGEEPSTPPPPPTPRPVGGVKGDASLVVGLGDGLSFTRRLDSSILSQLLDEKRDLTFTAAARLAEEEVDRFVATEGQNLASIRVPEKQPVGDKQPILGRILKPSGGAPAQPVPETQEKRLAPEVLTAVEGSDMSYGGKVMALYLGSGFSRDQARAELQSQLARSGGDAALAWERSKAALGAAAPYVTPSLQVDSSHLVEQMLVDALANPNIVLPPPPAPPPPPDPRSFSLVVVGGARVAATGNATTAGVHVHDAHQSVENNV